MRIEVLASSSRGNAYLLQGSGPPLLLECGLRYQDLQHRLWAREVSIADLAGVAISHEHGDHSKAARELIKAGIDVISGAGTFQFMGIDSHRARPIAAGEQIEINGWKIKGFEIIHDAAEPLGFLISDGTDKLVYATDTAYIKNRFREIKYYMIEANYSADILRNNEAVNVEVKKRVIRNHQSLENAIRFFEKEDLSRTWEIWLLHLSAENSDAEGFRKAVQQATGKPVFIADI